MSITANGTSTMYYASDTGSWFHNVGINVTSSTTYYYYIMAANCTRASTTYSFKAPPPDGESKPINIAIVGDLGIRKTSATHTIKALIDARNKTDLYLRVGDISYADDHFVEHDPETYKQEWNDFQNAMQPITTTKFYMTEPGNHEVTCIQGHDKKRCANPEHQPFRNFSAYLHPFRMPGDETGGFKNLWYSFTFGMVHIAVVTSETDFKGAPAGPNTTLNGGNFRPLGNQTQWLINDLDRTNKSRATVPWLVVAAHRPFFGSIPEAANDIADQKIYNTCRQAFAAIMEKYNVDFYFCGHVHWYERLLAANSTGYPFARNYIYQPGTIYVTSGAGGAPEPKQHIEKEAPAHAEYKSHYGYVNLEIKNANYSQLTFIETLDLVRKKTLDVVDIYRKH
ncbi:hypothetical protein I4U23_005298 [Adineta vaga]|nr:hypothetical protein I4U23_005298 [Adineta vaga]